MKNKISVDIESEELPPLHSAARNGKVEELRVLIFSNKVLVNCKDNLGLTALMHGALARSSTCIRVLLENGAKVNERDLQGRTALSYAIHKEWYEGVKILLEHGSKISTVDNNKRNAVHLATCCGDQSVLHLILRCSSVSDVNQMDVEGMTPLHWASFHNWPEQLQLLLQAQADILTKDKEGKTALHWGSQNGSVACVQLLLSADRDKTLVNTTNFEGRTPIHLAATAGHLDVVFELAQSPGIETEARDIEGRTALHWACATNKERIVAGLLRLGVSHDCKDNHGVTPLMYCRQANHSLCANLLLTFDPRNPQKTLIPVTSPNGRRGDVRSTESKKMKFSDNVDANSNYLLTEVLSLRRTETQTKERDESLDNLNKAFDGIMTCEVQSEQRTESEAMVLNSSRDTELSVQPSMMDLANTYNTSTVTGGDMTSNGYSSDEESRYPPQMAVTPPNVASPDISESEDESCLNIHSNSAASLGIKLHRLVSKQYSSPASTTVPNYELAPLRKKEVPDYLRILSTSSDGSDIQLPKSQSLELGPLRLGRDKQASSPGSFILTGTGAKPTQIGNRKEQDLSDRKPFGLRKKSLSMGQDLSLASTQKGHKGLNRSKSYGYPLTKLESSVLPSISPQNTVVKGTERHLIDVAGHNEDDTMSLKSSTSEKKKKKSRPFQLKR